MSRYRLGEIFESVTHVFSEILKRIQHVRRTFVCTHFRSKRGTSYLFTVTRSAPITIQIGQ